MSHNTRRIPPEEWNRHESAIKNLYITKGLVVKSKIGKPDLINTMRDKYGFEATEAQYLGQIKRWESPKKLERETSSRVIAIIDRLKEKGIEAMPVVSGRRWDKARLARTRRYLGAEVLLSGPSPTTQQLPPNITIVTLGKDNTWAPYQDTLELEEGSAPLHSQSPQLHEDIELPMPGQISQNIGSDLQQDVSVVQTRSPTSIIWEPPSALSPWHGDHVPSIDIFDFNNYFESPLAASSSFGPSTSLQLDFSELETLGNSPRNDTNNPDHFARQVSDLGRSMPSSALSIVQTMMNQAATVQQNSQPQIENDHLPDARDVLDRLMSLLDDDSGHEVSYWTSELATGDAIFNSAFHKSVIFSIANGFAGFQDVPRHAILAMLKEQHMSSQVLRALRQCQPAVVKSLADNLFHAAIESEDVQTVKNILAVVQGGPGAIDINTFVCEVGGRKFTPLALAAKLRNFEILTTLLNLGADVNRSLSPERTALFCAVSRWEKTQLIDTRIVTTLLTHGAKITPVTLREVVRYSGDHSLLQQLLNQLTEETHGHYFGSLPNFAYQLESDLALAVISKLFDFCKTTGCEQCSARNQKSLSKALVYAALRGNLELCKLLLRGNLEICRLLLCETSAGTVALSAAFRSRDRAVIDLLIEHGASPLASSFEWHEVMGYGGILDKDLRNSFDYCSISPFAESIRTQDDDLMRIPETAGSWSGLGPKEDLIAAIHAAAEVGDLCRLRRLLDLFSKSFGSDLGQHLSQALKSAFRHDKTQVILFLLETTTVDVNQDFRRKDGGLISFLGYALQEQNLQVVRAVLDCDVDITLITEPVIQLAVLWRNMSVLDDLIFLGADLDAGNSSTALSAAVKAGDEELVEKLLKHGADPSATAKSGNSPLAEAVRRHDGQRLTRFLLSKGADPADTNAFLHAIDGSAAGLTILLEAFKTRYPSGCPQFGGTVVIKGMKSGNEGLFHSLIAAKMDVHRYSPKHRCTPLGFAIQHQKGQNESWLVALLDAGADLHGAVSAPLGRGRGELSMLSDVWPRESALVAAVGTRNTTMATVLLRRKADVNEEARQGFKRTPLQKACEIGSYEMVELLLRWHSDVNSPAAFRGGGTALQLAAGTGSLKIVKLLLNRKADVNAPPSKVNGRSAFEAAAENGRPGVLKVLWSASGGFPSEEVHRALDFARKGGHRSCEDRIMQLRAGSS